MAQAAYRIAFHPANDANGLLRSVRRRISQRWYVHANIGSIGAGNIDVDAAPRTTDVNTRLGRRRLDDRLPNHDRHRFSRLIAAGYRHNRSAQDNDPRNEIADSHHGVSYCLSISVPVRSTRRE